MTSEKLIDTLRAVLEETDLRIAELKKDAYEFKRDIVVGAENMRTGRTMAEKVRACASESIFFWCIGRASLIALYLKYPFSSSKSFLTP